jgi:2'-5' RNA ligase
MADVRIFVALEMPSAVGQQVAGVAQRLSHLNQVRWVNPGGVHLTLKFLGDVAEGRMPEIVSAVQQVASETAPMMLSTADVGGFPKREDACVLWLGVGGDLDKLMALQKKVTQAFSEIGFEPERRRFFAHVTVGRVRRAPVSVTLEEVGLLHPVHFSVDRLTVMKSELLPGGARYTPLGYGIFEA